MGSRLARLLIPASIAVLALFAFACGSGDESTPGAKPGETAAKRPVTLEPGVREVTLPGADKKPVAGFIGSGELPDAYPKDIPPPPGAEVKTSIVVPGQNGLASFLSSSSRDDVLAHFMKELQAQGWKVESEQNDKRALVKAAKENRTATVNISEGKDGTEIVVTFQQS